MNVIYNLMIDLVDGLFLNMSYFKIIKNNDKNFIHCIKLKY